MLLIYFFLAVLGLRCFVQAFLAAVSRGYSLTTVQRLLVEVACLVVEHRLFVQGFQQLQRSDSVVMALGL